MRRDDQARLGRIRRTGQAQQPRKDTGGQAASVLNPETAMGASRRLSRVNKADRLRKLQPRGAQESRVERARSVRDRSPVGHWTFTDP